MFKGIPIGIQTFDATQEQATILKIAKALSNLYRSSRTESKATPGTIIRIQNRTIETIPVPASSAPANAESGNIPLKIASTMSFTHAPI